MSSDRAEGQEEEAHEGEQQVWVDSPSMARSREFADLIRLQTASISHDVGNVVLLLDSMKKV